MATLVREPQLKEAWFARIARAHEESVGESGLVCDMVCTARCCPHVPRASEEPTVSHVAIMLPFEMEYIMEHTGVDRACFTETLVEIAPGVLHPIGSFDLGRPCPFLNNRFQCNAYEHRPLDCRSFPLIPVFQEEKALSFRYGEGCPSLHTFLPEYQEQMKQVWYNVLPALSRDYRIVYRRL